MTATAQAPTNGATAGQFPGAERLLEKIQQGNPRHRAMPADLAAKMELAKVLIESGLCPKVGRKDSRRDMTVAEVTVILQCGDELGLAPLQSVQGIAVVEGRPSPMYQVMLAVVRSSGKLEDYCEDVDESRAIVTVKRVGDARSHSVPFSLDDARRAGITGNPMWSKYPRDMLRNRAGGRVLKIIFADVLAGIALEDEIEAEMAARQETSEAAFRVPAAELSDLRARAARAFAGDVPGFVAFYRGAVGAEPPLNEAGLVLWDRLADLGRTAWTSLYSAMRARGAAPAKAAAPAVRPTPSPAPAKAPAPAPAHAGKPFAQEVDALASAYNADPERMKRAAFLAKVDLDAMTQAGLEDLGNALTALDQADEERAGAAS